MSSLSIDDVLSCPSLPSLPAVAARLIELTGDPDVQISEIAKTVQQDQALAGKVLRTVNSSYYGLPQRCGSIDRAMGYLGLNTVKSLVLGFSLVETTGASADDGFDMVAHWRRTLMGATAARSIATRFKLSDKDEVFTAALFQDMGMLATFTAIQEQYIDAISGVEHAELDRFETERFGFSHTKVGSALAQKWQLPEAISDAIAFHHDPDHANVSDLEMVRAVAMGTRVAEALSSESPARAIRQIERDASAWFPGQKIEVDELLEEVNEASKELASLFNTEIGDLRDVQMLMGQAQERGLEHQISMQRQTEDLERQAVTDGLTGIPNRKAFDDHMETAHKGFTENSTGFAVLFFDADKFKSVNDTHGHAAGDAVLVELAKRTTDVVGHEGFVCRYGGEEFGVVLPGMTVLEAAMLAERVRSEIASTPFDLRGVDGCPDELPVTVSIGVSSIDAGDPGRVGSVEQLVVEADAGVYAAKEAGRNNVKVWTPAMGTLGEDSAEKAPALTIPAGDGTVKSMVLIEDDALAATLLITLVGRKAGIDVVWLKSGEEACSYFESKISANEWPGDVVVCDLNLPGQTGFEVYESFKEIGLASALPFYVLTAHDSADTMGRARELGISRCIGKTDFSKNISKWIKVFTDTTAKAA